MLSVVFMMVFLSCMLVKRSRELVTYSRQRCFLALQGAVPFAQVGCISTSVLVEVGKTFWFWLVLHRRPLFLSASCLLFHRRVSFFAHHRRAQAAHEHVQTLLVVPPPLFGDRCRM